MLPSAFGSHRSCLPMGPAQLHFRRMLLHVSGPYTKNPNTLISVLAHADHDFSDRNGFLFTSPRRYYFPGSRVVRYARNSNYSWMYVHFAPLNSVKWNSRASVVDHASSHSPARC